MATLQRHVASSYHYTNINMRSRILYNFLFNVCYVSVWLRGRCKYITKDGARFDFLPYYADVIIYWNIPDRGKPEGAGSIPILTDEIQTFGIKSIASICTSKLKLRLNQHIFLYSIYLSEDNLEHDPDLTTSLVFISKISFLHL